MDLSQNAVNELANVRKALSRLMLKVRQTYKDYEHGCGKALFVVHELHNPFVKYIVGEFVFDLIDFKRGCMYENTCQNYRDVSLLSNMSVFPWRLASKW